MYLSRVGNRNLGLASNSDASVFIDSEEWIPRYLPKETIWISKAPGIPAPERFGCGFEQSGTGSFSLRENDIDLLASSSVVNGGIHGSPELIDPESLVASMRAS